MKKSFTLLVFFFAFYTTNAQHFAISPDKNNVLYIGVDNPLTIAAENCPCGKLIVKTNNGTVTGNNCQYIYKGNSYGAADIILYKKIGGNLKEVGRNAFRVKRIPSPIFKIGPYGSFYNMNADRKAKAIVLATQQYVRAEIEGFDINASCTIDSFYVNIFYADSCKAKKFFNTSNKLSDSVKTAIAALKTNDVIYFNRIYAKCPDGTKELDPMILTIEN